MAKSPKENGTQAPEAAGGPMLQVLAQYIKDMSFENPNAPGTLRAGQDAPALNIGIEVGRQMLEGDNVEVVIALKAEAKREDTVVFIAELEYAGLFAFQNVSAEELLPIIMIECPRMLFPYARKILADMTSDGGYAPIMLDPPDFPGMFREEMARRSADIGEA